MAINGRVKSLGIASLASGSQTLAAANANRQFLLIMNIGNATIWINAVDGAAAASDKDSFELSAGGSLMLDHFVLQNGITVLGTAGQPVACLEG